MDGMSPLAKFTIAIVVLGAIGGGIYYWRTHQTAPAPRPAAPATTPPPPVAPAAPTPDAAPAIQNPLEVPKTPLPPLAESDDYVRKALIELLGKKGLLFLY